MNKLLNNEPDGGALVIGLPDTGLPRDSTSGAQAKMLLQVLGLPILFCILLMIGWEAVARHLATPLMPSLEEIGSQLVLILSNGTFFTQMWVTIERVFLGFVFSLVLSIVLGIATGRSKAVHYFLEPAVLLGLTVPGLVWALLCIIWFGVSASGSAIAVVLGITPALMLNVSQGVRAVDADLLELTHVLRLPLLARLRYLWLPTLVPFLLSGARLALSLAWKVIVLVEVFGLSSGIGYQLNNEFSAQNVAGVLAWTVCFSLVMALLEYGVLGVLERRVTRWRREAKN